MKNNDEKIIIFFNMHCDVHYYPAKFKIEIQFVYGKKRKRQIVIWCKMN